MVTKSNHTMPSNEYGHWNLADLFPSQDDAERAMPALSKKVEAFRSKYVGSLGTAPHATILASIQEYEDIVEDITRISTFAYLNYVKHTEIQVNVSFYTKVSAYLSNIEAQLAFFTLELNLIEPSTMQQHLQQNQQLARYKPFIDNAARFRPYQLSKEVEEVILKKSTTASKGWVDLHTKILCNLRFIMEGESITLPSVLNQMSDPSEEVRKKAHHAFSQKLSENQDVIAMIYSNIVHDTALECTERGFSAPISAMNLHNNIEDEVIEALLGAVHGSYKDTSHEYYKIKAKLLKKDVLNYWDRNAPLGKEYGDESIYTFEQATEIVLNAYKEFDEEIAEIGQKFFDNHWIDVFPKDGKDSGAFSHPACTKGHPYIMLNYMGRVRDVMTLAHELGHGVHQYLARHQGALMAGTPLTIAETASVFGEELTFRSILQNNTNERQAIPILCSKIEDQLNTVIRQAAFCNFEVAAHDTYRKEGHLSHEKLNQLWLASQKEALGEAVIVDESCQSFWAYISHFFHTPFYVYSYAMGNCLVNGLYNVYRNGSVPNFNTHYKGLLSAGGSKHHKELLAPMGIDLTQEGFWKDSLSEITGNIKQLQGLI